jgi:hypothetical protein
MFAPAYLDFLLRSTNEVRVGGFLLNLDRKSGIRGPKMMGEALRQHFVDLALALPYANA